MSLKIGNITLKHGLMLAPMAGVTDRTFRRICLSKGAEYTVSEMVSAKALCYEQRTKKKDISPSSTASLASVFEADMPMAIQIFGSEPEFMARAAHLIAERSYLGCESDTAPAAIDLNMGCPVRKIVSNGEGSAIMKNPALAGEIAKEVVRSVNVPVTVKIRAGWDENSKNAVEVAKRLEDAGVSAICVHGRTREQFYTPGIDTDIIARVKNTVKIPVIGNGDISTAADAENMFRQTGCDGIMIGRGAMGNPWLFEEIVCALEGREYNAPTPEERMNLALSQFEEMIALKGERAGFAEGKKHLAWYISGLKGSAGARNEIMCATSQEQVKRIYNCLLDMQ